MDAVRQTHTWNNNRFRPLAGQFSALWIHIRTWKQKRSNVKRNDDDYYVWNRRQKTNAKIMHQLHFADFRPNIFVLRKSEAIDRIAILEHQFQRKMLLSLIHFCWLHITMQDIGLLSTSIEFIHSEMQNRIQIKDKRNQRVCQKVHWIQSVDCMHADRQINSNGHMLPLLLQLVSSPIVMTLHSSF